jgi:hypothetical protein
LDLVFNDVEVLMGILITTVFKSLMMIYHIVLHHIQAVWRLTPALTLMTVLILIMGCVGPSQNSTETQPQVAIDSPVDTGDEAVSNDPVQDEEPTAEAEAMPETVKEQILEAIARDLDLSRDQFFITGYTRETWPDGCLGLGEPEEMCTMALVEGWQVGIVEDEGSFFYRTNLDGTVVRPIDSDDPTVLVPPSVGDRLLRIASEESGQSPDALTIVEAETQTWDGCLGVSEPDEMCPQIAIFGWRIIVSDGEQQWVYHINHNASDVRLSEAT